MAEKLVFTVDFAIVIDGVWVAGTVTVFELVDGMAEPPGGVPVTDAVFTTDAASRSAWVAVWLAVQVVDAPGARVVTGHEMPVTMGSVIVMELSVTAPVLRTTNVYGMVAPTAE